MLHEVRDLDEAVEVLVEGQEGQPYFLEALRDLELYLGVQGLDSLGKNFRLLLPVFRVLSSNLFVISVFIGLGLLLKDVQLREEDFSELVKTHAVRRHTVFHGAHDRHIIEEVEHLEAELDVFATEADPVHDRRRKNVGFENVSLAMKVHIAEGLLRAAIHVLEALSERLLDLLREVMLAEHVLEFGPVAVWLFAKLLAWSLGSSVVLGGSELSMPIALLSASSLLIVPAIDHGAFGDA